MSSGVEGLLPRVLYRYELDLHRVLDLTDPDTRTNLGITRDELIADDWTVCQQLGTEVHAVGDQGIRTYSATGVDTVLVVSLSCSAPASPRSSSSSGGRHHRSRVRDRPSSIHIRRGRAPSAVDGASLRS
jgi:hypothetical protein